jgi:hypothetical protein
MDGQDSQDFVLPLRDYLVHPVDPCSIDRELFESGKGKAQGLKSADRGYTLWWKCWGRFRHHERGERLQLKERCRLPFPTGREISPQNSHDFFARLHD